MCLQQPSSMWQVQEQYLHASGDLAPKEDAARLEALKCRCRMHIHREQMLLRYHIVCSCCIWLAMLQPLRLKVARAVVRCCGCRWDGASDVLKPVPPCGLVWNASQCQKEHSYLQRNPTWSGQGSCTAHGGELQADDASMAHSTALDSLMRMQLTQAHNSTACARGACWHDGLSTHAA